MCKYHISNHIETKSKYKIIIYWVYHYPHARIAIIFVTLYEFISPLDPHRELQGGQARQLHRHQGEELEQGEELRRDMPSPLFFMAVNHRVRSNIHT